MSRKLLIPLVILILILLAWAPWLNRNVVFEKLYQEEKEYDQRSAAAGLMDGCGFVEVMELKRIPFGFLAKVKYVCAEVAPGQEWQHTTIYISPLTTLHGERE